MPDSYIPVDAFALTQPDRDADVVRKLKPIYQRLGFTNCMYSKQPLAKRWDLDHVLPFSAFPVNYFWNLVPTDPRVNNDKRARLPVLTSELRRRYGAFVERCVASDDELLHEHIRATYREYFQRSAVGNDIAREVWQLFDWSYKRLEDAGVDVWEPKQAS